MSNFTGQKVIITGATRGIGKAIAKSFLSQGAMVIAVYGGNEESANAMAEDCNQYGDNLRLHRCDISNYQQVADFYNQVEEEFDTIDILINNAGIRRDGVLAMLAEEDWRRVIDVNLTGSYNASKFAVQLMMKQKYGRIIFITSPMAHMGFAGQTNYAASKAGQIGMMKSLSKETAKRKITVNAVSPGFIDTELLDDLSDSQLKDYRKMIPLRRFGKVDEVARTVLFLADKDSSYITGTVLDITGGL